MEVILLQSIRKLGQMGDVVNVKNGFARNWLIPQKLAARATEDAKKAFEAKKEALHQEDAKKLEAAKEMAGKLENFNTIIIRTAGDMGQLYGSVTPRNVADALKEKGFNVSRHDVAIPNPIKELGVYEVQIHLHANIEVSVLVNVALSDSEAGVQLKRFKEGDNAE